MSYQKTQLRYFIGKLQNQKENHLSKMKLRQLIDLQDVINFDRQRRKYAQMVGNMIKIIDVLDQNRHQQKNNMEQKDFAQMEKQQMKFLRELMINILDREDEELYRIAYQMRM